MAIEYPDILGEQIGNLTRYDANGVQFSGEFVPTRLALGDVGKFYLYLQNCLNVPANVTVKASIPQTARFRGHPLLTIGREQIQVELEPAAVGCLTLPLSTTEQARQGACKLGIELQVKPQGRGARVRPVQSASRLPKSFFDDLAGLQLVSTLGATYKARNSRKGIFTLEIIDPVEEPPSQKVLKPVFQSWWTLEDWNVQHKARHEVNDRRVQIIHDLNAEALFANLYAEGTERFVDCGVPLRIGEAIGLAKILTFTARYFLDNGPIQDGLLVPVWERALRSEYPTTDVMDLIRVVGYRHLIRLSAALSFGMVAQTLGRQPWPLDERRAIIRFLADALEEGDSLEEVFIYAPLMMGATRVMSQLRLENEDPRHSLQLLKKARQARAEVFADEDLQEISRIFDQLLSAALVS
ncbi:MAG: hypothetical protein ACE5H9_02740 [Anaerolineae bacterium]